MSETETPFSTPSNGPDGARPDASRVRPWGRWLAATGLLLAVAIWLGTNGVAAGAYGWAEAKWDLAHGKPGVKITGYYGYGGRVEDLAREELAALGVSWKHYGCILTPNIADYTHAYTAVMTKALLREHGRDIVGEAFAHAKAEAREEEQAKQSMQPHPEAAAVLESALATLVSPDYTLVVANESITIPVDPKEFRKHAPPPQSLLSAYGEATRRSVTLPRIDLEGVVQLPEAEIEQRRRFPKGTHSALEGMVGRAVVAYSSQPACVGDDALVRIHYNEGTPEGVSVVVVLHRQDDVWKVAWGEMVWPPELL